MKIKYNGNLYTEFYKYPNPSNNNAIMKQLKKNKPDNDPVIAFVLG